MENNSLITINETEKSFGITTTATDMEGLFLDKKNFVPMLDILKDRVRNLVADVHEKDGIAVRKSLNRKLAGLKNRIEEEGKTVAAALKAKPKKIDDTRKNVKDTIQMLQDEVMAPVLAIEARKNEIVEISNIPALAIGCDSEGIKQIIEQLHGHDHDLDYWDESFAEAQETIREAERQLKDMLAGAEKAEADARELEKLRAQQAEMERLQREEAERKQREAEAALRAEQEKARKAQEEAEIARREKAIAEAKAAEAQKKAEEVYNMDNSGKELADDAATKNGLLFPEDSKAVRNAAMLEAREDICKAIDDEFLAGELVKSIMKGEIRHIYFK